MNIHGLTARLRSTARKATGLNRRSDGTPYIRRVVAVPLTIGLLLAVASCVAGSNPNSAYWGSTLGDERVTVKGSSGFVEVTANTPLLVTGVEFDVEVISAPETIQVTVADEGLLINAKDWEGPGVDFDVTYVVTGVDNETGDTHRSKEVAHIHLQSPDLTGVQVNAGGAVR